MTLSAAEYIKSTSKARIRSLFSTVLCYELAGSVVSSSFFFFFLVWGSVVQLILLGGWIVE